MDEVREDKYTAWRPTGAPERLTSFGSRNVGTIDFLIKGRSVIGVSARSPIMTKLVRPVLQIDLPFIAGVDLRTFSQLTIDEFDSYTAFRDFLRERFENINEVIDGVHRDNELAKIGREIAAEVRAVHAGMAKVSRRRNLEAFGAGAGVVTAALVAVYGPALEEALTVLGLGAGLGGLWKLVQTISENSSRSVEGANKWYYVWALQKKARQL